MTPRDSRDDPLFGSRRRRRQLDRRRKRNQRGSRRSTVLAVVGGCFLLLLGGAVVGIGIVIGGLPDLGKAAAVRTSVRTASSSQATRCSR